MRYLTLLACLTFLELSAYSTTVWGQEVDPSADPTALIGNDYHAPKPVQDKSAYSILDPTPDDRLRTFTTDRPGKTHSSITVDAGHFQLEADIVNYTKDRYSSNQQTTRTLGVGAPILKAGVTDWMDMEIGLSLFNQNRVTDRGLASTTYGQGFGDTLLGSKINILGNEGARQQLALLPFIKFPTAASNVGNGVPEYSLNIPYTVNLDDLWSMTTEPALSLLKNNDDSGHYGDYTFAVNVNRPIFFDNLTAALEIASEFASGHQLTPRYTLDPALSWTVMPALQFDVGSYIGLNKAAPDYRLETGISFRY